MRAAAGRPPAQASCDLTVAAALVQHGADPKAVNHVGCTVRQTALSGSTDVPPVNMSPVAFGGPVPALPARQRLVAAIDGWLAAAPRSDACHPLLRGPAAATAAAGAAAGAAASAASVSFVATGTAVDNSGHNDGGSGSGSGSGRQLQVLVSHRPDEGAAVADAVAAALAERGML